MNNGHKEWELIWLTVRHPAIRICHFYALENTSRIWWRWARTVKLMECNSVATNCIRWWVPLKFLYIIQQLKPKSQLNPKYVTIASCLSELLAILCFIGIWNQVYVSCWIQFQNRCWNILQSCPMTLPLPSYFSLHPQFDDSSRTAGSVEMDDVNAIRV